MIRLEMLILESVGVASILEKMRKIELGGWNM